MDRADDLVVLNLRGCFDRSAAITWTLRVFYFVVLVNAAVMFARHWATGTVLMSICFGAGLRAIAACILHFLWIAD